MHEKTYTRTFRQSFVMIAWVFAVSITVQVLFAGIALFFDSGYWVIHASFARYLFILPLLMVLSGWVAHLPKKMLWRSIGLAAMMIGMFMTAILSSRIGVFSALHPVIALMLFWSSAETLRSYYQYKALLST